MVPRNTIAQEALQHFEMAYRYMAGTLAQESQVSSPDLLHSGISHWPNLGTT